MNVCDMTKTWTVSSIIMPTDPVPDELRDLIDRLRDGTVGGWEASCIILKALGGYESMEDEIRRLRRELRDARGIPQWEQPAPAQQQQSRAGRSVAAWPDAEEAYEMAAAVHEWDYTAAEEAIEMAAAAGEWDGAVEF